MSHRLSDNDRTLLSAYMDGEVSADEIRDAEQLLSGSEEARTYLDHLRAVHSVSVQAFPVVPVGAATGAAVGKLTASAISAAAKKSAFIKGLTLGPWGTAGIFAAAASVAVGVTVSLKSNDAPPVSQQHSGVHRAISQAALPAPINVDTSAMIVPPMTPKEMVRFAVDGIVPIDSRRDHFLSLGAHGQDSMVVSLHNRPSRELTSALDDIDPSQWQELDSIHRALRTALLQYKNGEIAIRYDVPSLRLKALEHLERLCQQLPTKVQEELTSVKREVEASRASMQAEEAGSARRRAIHGNRVPYVVVSLNELDQNGVPERIPIPPTPPNPFERASGSVQIMVVDGSSLDELQAVAPTGVVETQTFSSGGFGVRRVELRQRPAHTFNPTGELPSLPTQMPRLERMENPPAEFNQYFQQNGAPRALLFNNQISIQINGDSLIQTIQHALDVADSTLQHLGLPKTQQMLNQQIQTIQSNGKSWQTQWSIQKSDSSVIRKKVELKRDDSGSDDQSDDEGGNE